MVRTFAGLLLFVVAVSGCNAERCADVRDSLHDLYLFDPCDAEVFERARAFERHPRFQSQLKAVIEERRRVLRRSQELKRKLGFN